MPDLRNFHHATIDAIVGHAGGATLPFQQAHREGDYATSFWFNELVESALDGDVVRQYLVTAGEATRFDIAEVTVRPSLCAPAPSAEKLLMTDFAEGWTHLGTLGVAVMPTAGLHAHAERKGWRWNTDEITDGIAAREEDIAQIGEDPITAYVLGHDVNPDTGARNQVAVVGGLARAADDAIRWGGELPQGCVGAPVFVGLPKDDNSLKLVCVGVALPPDDRGIGHHPVATFDAIRRSLDALAAETPQPADTDTPRKRRWWQRST